MRDKGQKNWCGIGVACVTRDGIPDAIEILGSVTLGV